jgi:polyferredoxin
VYGGLLAALIAGFVVAVALRSPVALDVIRDRKSLYRLTDDGNVDNVYTVRILNKTEHAQRFTLEARGTTPLTLLPASREYSVPSGAVYSVPLRIRRNAYEPLGAETITLTLRSLDDPDVYTETEARFLAPTR